MKEYCLCVVVERLVVEVMLEVPKLTKAAVLVWELVVLEVVEVEEVEVVEVEVSVGERLAVNLSRKVRCVQGTPR